MIKKCLIAGLALLFAGLVSAPAEPVEGAFGGVFTKVADPDEGDHAREGHIVVIFDNQGKAWFKLNLGRQDGATAILSPAQDAWIPAGNRQFDYNYRDDMTDYVMHVKLVSAERLVLTEDFNAGGSPFGMGMTAGGEYELDYSYVADVNGFLYHKIQEGTELELCAEGRYAGRIQVPEAVSANGEVLPVAGVAAKAFWGNDAVTDVIWDHGTQYVGPSAFYRSGIHYYWDSNYSLPKYVYPSQNSVYYVLQSEIYDWDQKTPRWMFFKHNYAPLTFVEDRLKDEDAQWGYNPWWADDMKMQGVYFEMRVPSQVKKDMFRGYDPQEVIGLMVESRFAAFHRFPAFSRWKWGEKEQSMSATLEKSMESRYGRKLRQSRYIGHLREEDGRVGIFEFEPKDGEAMVVIAWTQGGKVKATYVKTTNIDPEYGEGSVWNVDDDGSYGIPELLCVAFDLHDNVILWFNHPAPESMNLYGLRQQGDQLQPFGEDQWYVYMN
jgi:hypothetical protein